MVLKYLVYVHQVNSALDNTADTCFTPRDFDSGAGKPCWDFLKSPILTCPCLKSMFLLCGWVFYLVWQFPCIILKFSDFNEIRTCTMRVIKPITDKLRFRMRSCLCVVLQKLGSGTGLLSKTYRLQSPYCSRYLCFLLLRSNKYQKILGVSYSNIQLKSKIELFDK